MREDLEQVPWVNFDRDNFMSRTFRQIGWLTLCALLMGCPLVTFGAEAARRADYCRQRSANRPATIQCANHYQKREASTGQTVATDEQGRIVRCGARAWPLCRERG